MEEEEGQMEETPEQGEKEKGRGDLSQGRCNTNNIQHGLIYYGYSKTENYVAYFIKI